MLSDYVSVRKILATKKVLWTKNICKLFDTIVLNAANFFICIFSNNFVLFYMDCFFFIINFDLYLYFKVAYNYTIALLWNYWIHIFFEIKLTFQALPVNPIKPRKMAALELQLNWNNSRLVTCLGSKHPFKRWFPE